MLTPQQEFLKGMFLAPITIQLYNLLTNQSSFYINNSRIHHYQLGLGMLLWGIIQNKPFWISFGSILIIDDIDDMIKDLNKKTDTY